MTFDFTDEILLTLLTENLNMSKKYQLVCGPTDKSFESPNLRMRHRSEDSSQHSHRMDQSADQLPTLMVSFTPQLLL